MCVLAMTEVVRVVKRRERRRRRVGTAYDTAVEVASHLPRNTRLLDVGCGEGFVAHHLTALLGTNVIGVDLAKTTAAQIEYLSYDGTRIPVTDHSFDGVLLSYVLHHVQDIDLVLSEVRRVVRNGGLVVVYEDIPKDWRDRIACWTHDLTRMAGFIHLLWLRDRLRAPSLTLAQRFSSHWTHAVCAKGKRLRKAQTYVFRFVTNVCFFV
jgi:SAM-dependent methyltransferase